MSGSPLIVDGRVIVISGGENDHGSAHDAESASLGVWSEGNAPHPMLPDVSEPARYADAAGLSMDSACPHDLSDAGCCDRLWRTIRRSTPLSRLSSMTARFSSRPAMAVERRRSEFASRAATTGRPSPPRPRNAAVQRACPAGRLRLRTREGILMCLEPGSGKIEWKKGRIITATGVAGWRHPDRISPKMVTSLTSLPAWMIMRNSVANLALTEHS